MSRPAAPIPAKSGSLSTSGAWLRDRNLFWRNPARLIRQIGQEPAPEIGVFAHSVKRPAVIPLQILVHRKSGVADEHESTLAEFAGHDYGQPFLPTSDDAHARSGQVFADKAHGPGGVKTHVRHV